jgi:dihydrofolate reductase
LASTTAHRSRSTLTDPEWNNTTVLSGDPIAEIKQLKEAPGSDIVQYGFGQLSFALLENGLLDELHLWVHPLVVGAAEPAGAFYRACATVSFELLDTTTLDNGIVILSYRFAEQGSS